MSNTEIKKDLYAELDSAGLLNYGSVIPGNLVREIIGIKIPEISSKSVFDQLALKELSAIDYVRNILLGSGKYITSCGSDYRILLPSENENQIDLYMKSADRKLRRAIKLNRNTPKEVSRITQTQSRLVMKRESIRSITNGEKHA